MAIVGGYSVGKSIVEAIGPIIRDGCIAKFFTPLPFLGGVVYGVGACIGARVVEASLEQERLCYISVVALGALGVFVGGLVAVGFGGYTLAARTIVILLAPEIGIRIAVCSFVYLYGLDSLEQFGV